MVVHLMSSASLRDEVCRANHELASAGLVAPGLWQRERSGSRSGHVPDQAKRHRLRRGPAGRPGRRVDRKRDRRRRPPQAILGHTDAPRAVSPVPVDRRSRPYPFDRGRGLRPGRTGDPLPRHDARGPFRRSGPGHAATGRRGDRRRLRGGDRRQSSPRRSPSWVWTTRWPCRRSWWPATDRSRGDAPPWRPRPTRRRSSWSPR